MQTIVSFLMRALGLGKAVDALDGETSKAYAGGVGQILAGAAGILGGLAGIAGQVVAAHGGADYLALVQGLAHNPSSAAILAGVGFISSGLAAIGQRHALLKAEAATAVAPVAPVAPAEPTKA